MSAALLIRAHKEKIQINPFSLSGILYPEIDNGYGEMVDDRSVIPTSIEYDNDVRISFLKQNIQKRNSAGTSVSVEKYVYFMISDNETIVDERLEFTYNNIDLRVTQRKEIRKFETLIGYEYELKDLTEKDFYG
jgi:hypothetical protein